LISINKKNSVIGRDSECGFPLADRSISRFHAVISKEGGEQYITGNNSTRGLFFNGKN